MSVCYAFASSRRREGNGLEEQKSKSQRTSLPSQTAGSPCHRSCSACLQDARGRCSRYGCQICHQRSSRARWRWSCPTLWGQHWRLETEVSARKWREDAQTYLCGYPCLAGLRGRSGRRRRRVLCRVYSLFSSVLNVKKKANYL